MGIVFIIWSGYNQTLSKNSQPHWPIIIPKFLLKTLRNKKLKKKKSKIASLTLVIMVPHHCNKYSHSKTRNSFSKKKSTSA